MSKRKFALLKRREEFQSHFTVLDIGTEFVKALIVKREDDKGIVLGVGKVRQAQSHMQAGAVADLQAVIDNCDQIVVGQRMSIGMSCDHRVIDGALGAEYLKELRHLLENPTLLLI